MEKCTRDQIPQWKTWDLTDLYKDDSARKADEREFTRRLHALVDNLESMSPGEAAKERNDLLVLFDHLMNYRILVISQDFTDEKNQKIAGELEDLEQKSAPLLSKLDRYFLRLSHEEIQRMIEDTGYDGWGNALLRRKDHELSEGEEDLLSRLLPVLQGPYSIYQGAKFGDLKFSDFTVNGKTYPLSFIHYEDEYAFAQDTELRRTAFARFSQELRQYHETIGTAFLLMVKRDLTLSKKRGYPTVFHYLLGNQNIEPETVHRHLELIMEHLSPIMGRYAKELAREYDLDTLYYSDLKLPPVSSHHKVTWEDAKGIVKKALAPLGDEVADYALRAFDERWVDIGDNVGKSTGGFCASPYGIHSYILMNWHDQPSDLYTLIHELGHAVHFHLAGEALPYVETEPSLYCVEAPSTTNELLLFHSLLKEAKSPEERRSIYGGVLANTYFHNFVTHFLEAYFQNQVYTRAEAGEILVPKDLDRIFKETLEKFWDGHVVFDDGAELTWMRQPHYYEGLYSYTYSAGLSIGTVMAEEIARGEDRTDAWLAFLRSGGHLSPQEQLELLGYRLDSPDVLLEALEKIGSYVDEWIGKGDLC